MGAGEEMLLRVVPTPVSSSESTRHVLNIAVIGNIMKQRRTFGP